MAMRRSVAALLRNTKRAMTHIVDAQHRYPHQQQKQPHHHHYHCGRRFHHHYNAHDSCVHCHCFFAALPGLHLGRSNFSTQATPFAEDHIKQHSETPPAAPPALSHEEARKLLKLMKMEDLRKLLLSTGNHCMPMDEVLKLCKRIGAAITDAEAEEVIKNLDEAGVVLIFRKRVFLQPDKVADLLAKTMPFHLASENDPRVQELAQLQREKEEIDRIAHRQVRNMLWGAFGAFALQSAVFFRLTFWDLSWDVMEPITFFVTSSSLLAGFFFFVLTHRDPSYHDLMETLLRNKQQKLMKKKHFNEERLRELQVQCCIPNHESRWIHAKYH